MLVIIMFCVFVVWMMVLVVDELGMFIVEYVIGIIVVVVFGVIFYMVVIGDFIVLVFNCIIGCVFSIKV